MGEAGINRFCVSAESFTPDNRYLMGESPDLKNFYLATGLNSTGIAAAPGVGKAVAEWIVAGEPTMDLWEVDIRRFHHFRTSRRTCTTGRSRRSGRCTGCTTRTGRWRRRVERGGRRSTTSWSPWGRATARSVDGSVPTGTRHRAWSRCTATRSDGRTGSRTRVRSTGPSVNRWGCSTRPRSRSSSCRARMPSGSLRRIFAGQMAVDPGRIVYTGMLNEQGRLRVRPDGHAHGRMRST